jgi:hypothetical protein
VIINQLVCVRVFPDVPLARWAVLNAAKRAAGDVCLLRYEREHYELLAVIVAIVAIVAGIFSCRADILGSPALR